MASDGYDLEFALKRALETIAEEHHADLIELAVVQTSALANTLANVGLKLGMYSRDDALRLVGQIRKRLEAAVDAEVEVLTRPAERN